MTDPWLDKSAAQKHESETNGVGDSNEFEDNFTPSAGGSVNGATRPAELQPLPDSDSYLKGLERKLQRIKKNSNLIDALADKRQDCMRALLQCETNLQNNNAILELEESINDSAVQEIYRFLQPKQPLSVGETVHIVKHDQLEEQSQENTEEDSESGEERVEK